ncbi:hypothetical protein ABZW30_32925 [Kitasatospora sp. NPDC004669]|uniref:hypothetical protein n=1 Tax=Kitasatospora sp. NPDC004669 TaxID=3154555 RepID=UPI0033BC0138
MPTPSAGGNRPDARRPLAEHEVTVLGYRPPQEARQGTRGPVTPCSDNPPDVPR